MADQPFIISPAGFIAEYDWTTKSMSSVHIPLAGEAVAVVGQGQHPVTQVQGQQGTLQIVATLGAAGTARALAFLVDSGNSPTKFIGMGLDASNRPTAYIHTTTGALVGVFAGSVALTQGAQVEFMLSWNSSKAVSTTHFASLRINGTLATGTWSTDPTASWVSFVPNGLLVGSVGNSGFQTLSPFNGSVKRTKVSQLSAT